MDEFAFRHVPHVTPGRVVFDVTNTGRIQHQLVLAFAADLGTETSKQSGPSQRRGLPTVAILPDRGPGESDELAVDLVPGIYEMHCFLRGGPNNLSHSKMGMNSELRVE